jgi:hypothetical protein
MTMVHANVWAETAVAEILYPPLAESIHADKAIGMSVLVAWYRAMDRVGLS